jgi:hypothetical protein
MHGTLRHNNTRKNHKPKNTTKKNKESYIYLIAYGGLCDCIVQLGICMHYAIKHKRSILLKLYEYSASNLKDVFDFSKFPVPVYTETEKIHRLVTSHRLYPPVDVNKYNISKPMFTKWIKKGTAYIDKIPGCEPFTFDTNKTYPRDTILIKSNGGRPTWHGSEPLELEFFRNITLHPSVIQAYKDAVKEYKIPEEYVAVHLRATDKPLSFVHNILGMNKQESNHMKENGGVDAFIEKYAPMPTYIATDNKKHLEKYKEKYPSVIHSVAAYKTERPNSEVVHRGLHRNGVKDPSVLVNAIVDLIILAKAKVLMTSVGGYTGMAKLLWQNKDVLEHILTPLLPSGKRGLTPP